LEPLVPVLGVVAFLTLFLGIFRHVLSLGLYSGSFDQLIGLYLPGKGIWGMSHWQEGAAIGILVAIYGFVCIPLALRIPPRPLRIAASLVLPGLGLLCICVVITRYTTGFRIAKELQGQRNIMAMQVERLDLSNPRMRDENEWTRRRFQELDAAWREYSASKRTEASRR
jgi:hypothetical protein